jgi:hypothetical protein
MSVNKEMFSQTWFGNITNTLRLYLSSEGCAKLSKNTQAYVLTNLLELDDGITTLNDIGIKVDYINTLSDIYKLIEQCTTHDSLLKPVMQAIKVNLAKYLQKCNIDLSQIKLSNTDKLRLYELSLLDSMVTNASNQVIEEVQQKQIKKQNKGTYNKLEELSTLEKQIEDKMEQAVTLLTKKYHEKRGF